MKKTTSTLMSERQKRVTLASTKTFREEAPRIEETLRLADNSEQTNTVVNIDEPLFQPSPPRIEIPSFEPFRPISVDLTFRNKDKFARRVRIVPPVVSWLSVTPKDPALSSKKVAPGMEVRYVVKFSPQEKSDFSCEILCITEREKFVVPVHACGARALLNFPDVVSFGNCPVRYDSEKTLLVRNIGDKPAHFTLSTELPFQVRPKEGILTVDKDMRIDVVFSPQEPKQYSGEVMVEYDSGEAICMKAEGVAENVLVKLESRMIEIDPTYIGLNATKRIKLLNNSDYKVNFVWKALASDLEDESRRKKWKHIIDEEEKQNFLTATSNGSALSLREKTRISRQSEMKRKKFLANELLFVDDAFRIEPLHGSLYPNSSQEFTVTFSPPTSASFHRVAFLDVAGRENRLSLEMAGQGIGPKLSFSYESLDIGEIFVNSKQTYEFVLENRGYIEARYHLDPSRTLYGSKFRFYPSSGVLAPLETQIISAEVCSDLLGEFSEIFEWKIQGNPDALQISIAGVVIGPTFNFDVEKLDYGDVSLGFLSSRNFNLNNTSMVPLDFVIRVPEDGQLVDREFDIIPSSGTILPLGKQKIQLDFLANTVKDYNYNLVVDVPRVGESLLRVPITSKCIVPTISLSVEKIDFDECYIGQPCSNSVDIMNSSPLPAKFEIVLPSNDKSTRKAFYEVDQVKGIVVPRGRHSSLITVTAEVVQPLTAPIYFRVPGSDVPPKCVMVNVNVVGPKVKLNSESISFGKCEVLRHHKRTITIENECPVGATYICSFKAKNSAFSANPDSGIVKPQEKVTVEITGFIDETMPFRDQMEVQIQNGETFTIPVKAAGVGTCLVPSIPLDSIDFGCHFTTHVFSKEVVLENQGRKAQNVSWSCGVQRGRSAKDKVWSVFFVQPENVVIPAKSSQVFQLSGCGKKEGEVEDKIICQMESGRSFKPVYECNARVVLCVPLLEFSTKQLTYEYIHSPGGPRSVINQHLSVKNVSDLPLGFSVYAAYPFACRQDHVLLDLNESLTFNVEFDPAYRDDMITHTVNNKLVFSYDDHPQKDNVELTAEVDYPNLELSHTEVDFGCILSDTEKRVCVSITNSSRVLATYAWTFEEDIEDTERSSAKKFCDIFPISGVLEPGETEDVEFVLTGEEDAKVDFVAVCDVEGGPSYEVSVKGEAATLSYKLDKDVLDFGEVMMNVSEERDFSIQNTGKVALQYSFDVSTVGRPGTFEISSLGGKINAGDKLRFVCRFCPGLPDLVESKFFMTVGLEEPKQMIVKGLGAFPRISLLAPRVPDPLFDSCMKEARRICEIPLEKRAYPLPTISGDMADTALLTGKSSISVARGNETVGDLPLVVETERLVLRQRLLDKYGKALQKILKNKGSAEPEMLFETVQNLRESVQSQMSISAGAVLARYKIDFGAVVKGTTKKKLVRVYNSGHVPVSFSVDKRILVNSGFSVQPEKVSKLPGYPKNEFQDIQITLNSKGKGIGEGPLALTIPFRIRSGPAVHVELNANIVVPGLSISNDKIDFGRVWCGQTKVFMVRLKNDRPLSCEWSVKKLESAFARYFDCKPRSGVIGPDEFADIHVSYSPTDEKNATVKIPIRVKDSSKQYSISCRGSGAHMALQVVPHVLTMGSVLPYNSEISRVVIKNTTARSIELFCKEFDKQYLLEDNILRTCGEFEGDVMLLPERLPGNSLPDFLIEKYEALRSESESKEEVGEVTEEEGTNVVEQQTTPESFPSVILVVHGPTISGMTSVCEQLAGKSIVPVLNFDDVVEATFYGESELSSELKEAMKESEETTEGAAEQVSLVHKPLPLDLLKRILEGRFHQEDCARGCIVDGLSCSFTENEGDSLRAVSDLLRLTKSAVCLLNMKERDGHLRRSFVEEKEKIAELEGVDVKFLTEDEFETMSEAQQVDYESALEQSRKLRSAISVIRRERGKLLAQEETEVKEENEEETTEEAPEDPFSASYYRYWKALEEIKQMLTPNQEQDDEKTTDEQTPLPENVPVCVEFDATKSLEEVVQNIVESVPQPEAPVAAESAESSRLDAPVVYQRVVRPLDRPAGEILKYFSIVTPPKEDDTEAEEKEEESEEEGEPTTEEEKDDVVKTRWIVEPEGSVELEIHFTPDCVGEMDSTLTFVPVGGTKEYRLNCSGKCAYPRISEEPRSVFYRSCRIRPTVPGRFVQSQYVLSEKLFDFGPLLIGQSSQSLPESALGGFQSKFRITNAGYYDAVVQFAFESGESFSVEPKTITLEADAMEEVLVSCFPKNVGPVEDKFVALVQNNPQPVVFNIRAEGAKPTLNVDVGEIKFGRLLRGAKSIMKVSIGNVSSIPLLWKLKNAESLGDQFSVSIVEGRLNPAEDTFVFIDYEAGAPAVETHNLEFAVFDEFATTENAPSETHALSVEAESYEIDVHCELPEDGLLNFGTVKVDSECTQTFSMLNQNPKYDVGFKFYVKPHLASYFRVEPSEGVLKPGGKDKLNINLLFSTKSEISFISNKDIVCHYVEPEKDEVLGQWNLDVSVRAVFSKYTLLPSYGLSFGPHVYETSKVRKFEIRNDGEFAFEYVLEAPGESNTDEQKGGQKGAPKGGAGALTLGRFSLTPTSGTIAPGESAVVSATFSASGSEVSTETVSVSISDRDPIDHPSGISYTLEGETCIPGINATDFVSIFEEQQVFSVLPRKTDQRSVFSEEGRFFFFGVLLVGESMSERFKISNPNKIPCDVDVGLVPTDGQDSEDMKVIPSTLSIPAHEHRYITLTFSPSSLQPYSRVLKAVVQKGTDPKSKELVFEIRGEATLPHVTVEEPKTGGDGSLQLQFPRCFVGRETRLPVSVRNDGVLPSSIRMQCSSQEEFRFGNQNQVVSLESGEHFRSEVVFHPLKAGTFEAELKMFVSQNRYEDTTIKIRGEGFKEDYTFEDLPGSEADKLAFGECAVGSKQQIVFAVGNHTDRAVRFNWVNPVEKFQFSPATGHLLGNSIKSITLEFESEGPLNVEEIMKCKFVQIEYVDGEVVDWDDRKKSVRWEKSDDGKMRKMVEAEPEPEHNEVEGTEVERQLSLSGIVDFVKAELDVSPLQFKPTLMFQSRSVTLPVKNIGAVPLAFSMTVVEEDGVTEDEDPPFTVSHTQSVVRSGDSCSVMIRYAPKDVEDHRMKLKINIPHREVDAEQCVNLIGRSVCPVVHFDVSFSDYISNGRRPAELPGPSGESGPLDASTRVVEIESRGVKIRNTKRFYILNPTNMGYEFKWVCLDAGTTKPSIRCVVTRGTVHSGKKMEMVFEYVPTNVELCESFWNFVVEEHKLEIPFLFVGRASEPEVCLDRGHVDFKALLVNRKAREEVRIINKELVPFGFSFDPTSFDAGMGKRVLDVQPMSGTIGAESSEVVTVTFTPDMEESYNFNVVCNVRRKPVPLSLNVKGEAYMVHESLHLETTIGDIVLLSPDSRNYVDFGRVHINEKHQRKVVVLNNGKHNFDFQWNMGRSRYFTINPERGVVRSGEHVTCEILFAPTQEVRSETVKAVCNVTNGNSYVLNMSGSCALPQLHFSFYRYDFGPQFLYHQGAEPAQVTLVVANEDEKDVSFDVLFESKPHLEVKANPSILRPGEEREILVLFYPRESCKYEETVEFDVNGLYSVNIVVEGEGTPAIVELANPALRAINFGAVRVGDHSRKSFGIVSRSRIPLPISLSDSVSVLSEHSVSVSEREFVLRPRDEVTVEMAFHPTSRMRAFTVDLKAVCPGVVKTLLPVVGSALGVEIKLEPSVLNFGPVVEETSVTRRVVLDNSGDVGITYSFVRQTIEFFSVAPGDGFLPPHTELPVEITFSPKHSEGESREEISAKFSCIVESSTYLELDVSGICVDKPPVQETLSFKTPVRKVDEKSVTVKNPSSADWNLKPVFDSDIWNGEPSIPVRAGQSASYTVRYVPLFMSGESVHEGTLFIPLPDGNALLYALQGSASVPEPENPSVEEVEVPAKAQYVHSIRVENWLKQPQRFRVSMDLTKDDSTSVKGLDYIDIPAKIVREYRLSIYPYKEGSTKGTVRFTNEESGEYMSFNVSFKHTPPATIESIELETGVRQAATYTIKVENPLEKEVKLTTKSSKNEVIVEPSEVIVGPCSEEECSLKYFPLLVEKASAQVSLECPELGVFPYEVSVQSYTTGTERTIHFEVPLGGSQLQKLRFLHYLQAATDYTVKLDSIDFEVEQRVVKATAAVGTEGSEVEIPVVYRPSRLGEQELSLVLSSPQGGEFLFVLQGVCTAPKPQGPFVVKSGGSVNIPFLNVFEDARTFSFVVDNPAFQVKPSEQIPPRKSTQVAVSYKPSGTGDVSVGKLVVTCERAPTWIFYLRGAS